MCSDEGVSSPSLMSSCVATEFLLISKEEHVKKLTKSGRAIYLLLSIPIVNNGISNCSVSGVLNSLRSYISIAKFCSCKNTHTHTRADERGLGSCDKIILREN